MGEFGMGARVEHDFTCEDYYCDYCNSRISFCIRVFEYPVGAIEYTDYEATGCEVEYTPEIDYYDFDIPEEYEEYIADDVIRLIEQIKIDPSSITDREFEELVAKVFNRNGYNVELTPAIKDGGKDVIATKNVNGIPICLYIECKRYDINNPVGVSIVRSAAGVRDHDRVNKAIIVTTSRFTRGAFSFANEDKHMIQLMDLNDLLNMIN